MGIRNTLRFVSVEKILEFLANFLHLKHKLASGFFNSLLHNTLQVFIYSQSFLCAAVSAFTSAKV